MPNSIISTSTVTAVLKAFANAFIEDVPAVHRGGEYLIRYDDLKTHLNTLTYEDTVNIMLEAEANYL